MKTEKKKKNKISCHKEDIHFWSFAVYGYMYIELRLLLSDFPLKVIKIYTNTLPKGMKINAWSATKNETAGIVRG